MITRGKQKEQKDNAARKLQRTWLRRYTRQLAMRVQEFGMTSAIAKVIAYPELSSRLREKDLIQTMKEMVFRVHVLTTAGAKLAPEVKVCPARALPRSAQRACYLFRLYLRH